jgi:rod shape-determining protein MreD
VLTGVNPQRSSVLLGIGRAVLEVLQNRNVVWTVVVIACALLQTTWLRAIEVTGVVPDLTCILVVYFAMTEGEERAMWTAVLGGMFQDVAAYTTLGHHILGLVVVGYLAGRLTTRLVTEHQAVKAGVVFCGALLQGGIYTTGMFIQKPGLSTMHTFIVNVAPGAFYTALVAPILFLALDRAFRRPSPLQAGGV